MGTPANTIDVEEIGTGTNHVVPAGDLQSTLNSIQGTTGWAADTAGEAKGTADWAASKLGALHYHLQQIGALVNYTVPALDDL